MRSPASMSVARLIGDERGVEVADRGIDSAELLEDRRACDQCVRSHRVQLVAAADLHGLVEQRDERPRRRVEPGRTRASTRRLSPRISGSLDRRAAATASVAAGSDRQRVDVGGSKKFTHMYQEGFSAL